MIDKLRKERKEVLKKYNDTKNLSLNIEGKLIKNLQERASLEDALAILEKELQEYSDTEHELLRKIFYEETKEDKLYSSF